MATDGLDRAETRERTRPSFATLRPCLPWLVSLVLGLAMLRVPTSADQFNPNAFVLGSTVSFASTLGGPTLLFCLVVLGLGCLVFGLRNRQAFPLRGIKCALAVVSVTLVVLQGLCAAMGGSEAGGPFDYAIRAAAAFFCVLSVLAWAILVEPVGAPVALTCLMLSFALSVPLVAVAQELAGRVGLSRTTGDLILMLLSAALCVAMPRTPDSLRRLDEPPLRERTRSLALVHATLMLYILCTAVLRTLTASDLGGEALYKTDLSKILLFAVALLMAVATAVGVRLGQTRVPWVLFFGVCLLALYFSIAFAGVAPLLCQEVIFPSRMYAYFLLLVLSYVWAKARGSSMAATMTSLFTVSVALARMAFIAEAPLVSSLEGRDALVAPALAATALIMTVLVVALMAASFRARQAAPETAPKAGDSRHNRCVALGVANGLTAREAEVLELIALGRSRRRIGEQLGLSSNTVNSYAKAAYAKLGLHDRQDAIDWIEARL